VQGGGDAQQFQMTAEQARSEISQLRGSDEFMKHYLSLDKLSQSHKGAVEKMQRLHAIAYPEAA
jgi:hypothetical protein